MAIGQEVLGLPVGPTRIVSPSQYPTWVRKEAAFTTERGALLIADCLATLKRIPDETFDLVITSPPYDGQPKYGNGEKYEREWYADFFRHVSA